MDTYVLERAAFLPVLIVLILVAPLPLIVGPAMILIQVIMPVIVMAVPMVMMTHGTPVIMMIPTGCWIVVMISRPPLILLLPSERVRI